MTWDFTGSHTVRVHPAASRRTGRRPTPLSVLPHAPAVTTKGPVCQPPAMGSGEVLDREIRSGTSVELIVARWRAPVGRARDSPASRVGPLARRSQLLQATVTIAVAGRCRWRYAATAVRRCSRLTGAWRCRWPSAAGSTYPSGMGASQPGRGQLAPVGATTVESSAEASITTGVTSNAVPGVEGRQSRVDACGTASRRGTTSTTNDRREGRNRPLRSLPTTKGHIDGGWA